MRSWNSVVTRLEEMSALADDWYDDESEAPGEELCQDTQAILERVAYEYKMPLPYIYPAYEKGLHLEFFQGSLGAEAVIRPSGHVELEIYCVKTYDTKEEFEFTYTTIEEVAPKLATALKKWFRKVKYNGDPRSSAK